MNSFSKSTNIFSVISDYAYRNKAFLFITFITPPLAWLGIVYLGSLLILLMHSFFYLDGFTGQIVYKFSFQTLIEFPGFEIVIFLARTCSKGSIVTLIVVIPGNG